MDKCSDSTGDSSDDEPLSKLTKKLKTDGLSDTNQSELDSQPDPRKASDDSTGDSSDDEPLSSFVKKSKTDDLSNTTQSELNSQSTSNKDGFNTSDDEPLKKMVRISLLPVKMPGQSKGNKRGSARTEKTAAESSDDEPLIRHSKKHSSEKTAPLPLKKRPVNRARKNSNVNQSRDKHADSDSDSTSNSSDQDYKPLSNTVKRKKTPTSAARKSPRKVPNKLQRSGESWDSSDDEPLIRMTRSSPGRRGTLVTKRGRRANSNRHKGKKLRKEEEDSDDEPLIRLVKKPIKKTRAPAKKTLVPEKTVVSRKKSVNRAVKRKKTDTPEITSSSDHSSDDEPLIKLVKNPSNPGRKTRAARRAASVKIPNLSITERSRRNTKPVQYTRSSNDDSSDDEPLITMVKKPLITKTPMLELERVEDAFDNYTSKICGGKEENPAGELLVKVITSPPEPLGDSEVEERGKGEVNCDKEP